MGLFFRDSSTNALDPNAPTSDRAADVASTDTSNDLSANEALHIPRFGARAKARELALDVQRLRGDLERLGAMDAVELERRREQLRKEIEEEERRRTGERIEHTEALERERANTLAAVQRDVQQLEQQRTETGAKLEILRHEVVKTEDLAMLQEVGVYEYRHPLDDSVAYKSELARLKDQIKAMARADGGAVTATTNWTVNSSAAQGRKMVRDFSKLMLRAYNAEADTLVRGLKPYKLASAEERLGKVRLTIAKLGATMDIQISLAYHLLRVRELELTADYLEKLAEEKEREREERERLREERKVQQEMERERQRLEKERQHHQNALDAVRARGDADAIERMEAQLADIERKIEDVDYRAANIRAGYVYVISNLGAFGEGIVKVGLTRRLEPLDRIRELGDASVPFRFDVHALFFAQDAVGIETSLHARLADRRVNRVNLRREFFYATPAEVREHLVELAGELLTFEEVPEALEFRQSQRNASPAAAIADSDGDVELETA
jgi:hypothetical protein